MFLVEYRLYCTHCNESSSQVFVGIFKSKEEARRHADAHERKLRREQKMKKKRKERSICTLDYSVGIYEFTSDGKPVGCVWKE